MALSGFRTDPVLSSWVRRTRPRFDLLRHRNPKVDALVTLWNTRADQPDFLGPPPLNAEQTIEREIAIVRATSEGRARAQIARTLAESGQLPSSAALGVLRSPDLVDLLADGLEEAWRELIEPDWPAMHAVLQKDVLYRAGLLATHGLLGYSRRGAARRGAFYFCADKKRMLGSADGSLQTSPGLNLIGGVRSAVRHRENET